METNKQHSPTPSAATESADLLALPEQTVDLIKFRASKQGRELAAWVRTNLTKSRTERSRKETQWRLNLAFIFGQQYAEVSKMLGDKYDIRVPDAPKYKNRKTINRIRSFTRTEHSKFLSQIPSIVAVPATGEIEDTNAAQAAEQVLQSYTSGRMLRRQYGRAMWWKVATGNGFLKTWWDPKTFDRFSGQMGDIEYNPISPFHLFVPDLREREIEDQPFVIEAKTRSYEWVKRFYEEELKGEKLAPSSESVSATLDDVQSNLAQASKSHLDSVIIYEAWIKPGATNLMPQGGLVIMVEDIIVGVWDAGLPYQHGMFPYTKFEHMSNETFYADSPIVDLIPIQREMNEYRTEFAVAARRMARPQLLVQRGSLAVSKLTNEPGSIIQYNPGFEKPQPLPMTDIPSYATNNLEQALRDFEDLSGQHEISRGQAPSGIESGTALSFLKEADDSYLTPQYHNVEEGFENVSRQTIELFNQYVDMPRKIKVVGLDGSMDTRLLQGSDVAKGLDVRVEQGSSVGQSQAAKQAKIIELWNAGILTDQNQALRLLEMGGAQKVLDVVNAAERKAQRENLKIKTLREQEIAQHGQQMAMNLIAGISRDLRMPPEMAMNDPEIQAQLQNMPPMVRADDFDLHAVHIETHDRFRMSQEYEALPDAVKEQFDKHVEHHKMLLSEQMMQQAQQAQLAAMSGAPEDPGASMGDNEVAANGVVPAPDSQGGQ